MLLTVHILVAAVYAFVAAEATQQKCEAGWKSFGESCYLLTDDHDTDYDVTGPAHYDAVTNCKNKLAHLVEIESEEENDFLKSWLSSEDADTDTTKGVWIGATYNSFKNAWTWESSDENITYSDWVAATGQQPSQCASMSPSEGYSWVPEGCFDVDGMKYVCEQHLCYLPAKTCFQGTCYTISCVPYSARETEDFIFYRDFYYEDSPSKLHECPHGSLVKIETKEENDFIKSFLSNIRGDVESVWTAGYGVDDNWAWDEADGVPITFTDWAPSDQQGDDDYDYYYGSGESCVSLSRADGWSWKETFCSELKPIICEFPDPDAQ